MGKFVDRTDAGEKLAVTLKDHLQGEAVVVLGLPRGGVVVAYEVARVLHAPLDVVVVRKVSAPFQPELAMGAIGEGDVLVTERDVVVALQVTEVQFCNAVALERVELERRIRRYRECRGALDIQRRAVVVVDDGVATGATALAALESVRRRGARRIVMATPIASVASARKLVHVVDELVVLAQMHGSNSVGSAYEHFPQTSDREVVSCLARAQRWFEDPYNVSSSTQVLPRPLSE